MTHYWRQSIRLVASCWIRTVLFLPLLAGCNLFSSGLPGGTGSTGSTGSAGSGATCLGGATSTTTISDVVLEQLSLERINRARLKPGDEASANNIAIDEGIPGQLNTTAKQAVAMNDTLSKVAAEHSQDMIDNNYFAHNTPTGTTPSQRVSNAGYVFSTTGENLAYFGTTGTVDQVAIVEQQHTDLFVDTSEPSRGHRLVMLNENFREVGIGIVRGNYTDNTGQTYDSIMQTQDYGTTTSSGTFVFGVVYNDTDNDGQYDAGEGLNNVTVSLGGTVKTTNVAGGYTFEVRSPGSYTLQFASCATQSLTIKAGDPNIKVDLVNNNQVVVNLGLGTLP